MMSISTPEASTPPIYAYYYPLTSQCSEKQRRATAYGVAVPDEMQLAKEARPFFPGHDQPKIYCLGDSEHTQWDDADPETMRLQIELARSHRINGFILDSYIGEKDGRRIHEVSAPLNNAFGAFSESPDMRFGVMSVMNSPHILLPMSGKSEADRHYDYTKGTAEAIVDACALNYWDRDNYIRIADKPYLSLWFYRFGPRKDSIDQLSMLEIADHLKSYSEKKYRVTPYLVGICLAYYGAQHLRGSSFDALTGYAYLPDFNTHESEPVQDYDTMVGKRAAEWEVVQARSEKPFVPPVVLGWDASPRGIQEQVFEEVQGRYPYTPIVTGNTPQGFHDMLVRQEQFVAKHVPPEERYLPICSWNEITEGNALLPRIRPDGSIDDSYLRTLGAFAGRHLSKCS